MKKMEKLGGSNGGNSPRGRPVENTGGQVKAREVFF